MDLGSPSHLRMGNLQLRWDWVTAPAVGTSVGVASPPCHCTALSCRAGLAVDVTPLDLPVGAPQRGSCPLPRLLHVSPPRTSAHAFLSRPEVRLPSF